jgi:hypothetical protein
MTRWMKEENAPTLYWVVTTSNGFVVMQAENLSASELAVLNLDDPNTKWGKMGEDMNDDVVALRREQ